MHVYDDVGAWCLCVKMMCFYDRWAEGITHNDC